MTDPRFSLILPTRHRPEFVRKWLSCAKGHDADYEIIVSDNYVDEDLSAKTAFFDLMLPNAKYVTPPKPLGMVDNWNYALDYAKGEYVLFFTDKTFLLPNAICKLDRFLTQQPVEMVNWTSDGFSPFLDEKPFESGIYSDYNNKRIAQGTLYDPVAALHFKSIANTHRSAWSIEDYVRGKICFGAFHRSLISRIADKYDQIFYPISPDYTSMILGLSATNSAADTGFSGVVQVNVSNSNGGLGAINDLYAKKYLVEVGKFDDVIKKGLVDGLYSSQSANVAYDFINMKRKFNLPFPVNNMNWLLHAASDIYNPNRFWSDQSIKVTQIGCLERVIKKLNIEQRKKFYKTKKLTGNNLNKLKFYLKLQFKALAKKLIINLKFGRILLKIFRKFSHIDSVYVDRFDHIFENKKRRNK